jgi:rhamnosyltransferase
MMPAISNAALQHTAPSGFYAGLVLYHPEGRNYLQGLGTLLAHGIHTVVFDNSEDAAVRDRNRSGIEVSSAGRSIYLEADGNLGLAAAFNRIVQVVREDPSAQGLFLFDQDTDINHAALQQLLASFDALLARGPLGLLAAYPVRVSGIPYRIRRRPSSPSPGPALVPVDMAPSSFSLIPLTTISNVGAFQEDFFIDHIDWDFCLRCWRSDLPVFVDTRASFLHRVGEGDVVIGERPLFPICSPFRHYYQMRNMLLSNARAYLPLHVSLKALAVRAAIVAIVALYAGDVFGRLRFAWRGLIDGIKGRGGRLTERR